MTKGEDKKAHSAKMKGPKEGHALIITSVLRGKEKMDHTAILFLQTSDLATINSVGMLLMGLNERPTENSQSSLPFTSRSTIIASL